MADIAILVAEEYERRVRQTTADSRLATAEFDLWKNFPAKIAIGVNEEKIESLMKKFEAKSEFALAISQSFFSA